MAKCYDCKEPAEEGKTRCRKHIDKSLEKGRQWRMNNLEKVKASRKKSYALRREQIKQRSKAWSANNKERKAANSKAWALNNPDRVLNSRVKKFGLTAIQYNELLAEQAGMCAICASAQPKGRGRFVVDHCHAEEKVTGKIKVRGLLCNTCNLALGYLNDDISLFAKAIDYLVRNGNY